MRIIFFLAIAFLIQSCSNDSKIILKSPNSSTISEIGLDNESLSFNLIFDGDSLLEYIKLELKSGKQSLLKNARIINIEKAEIDESWNTVIDKNKTVRNYYNQFIIKLGNETNNSFSLEIRVYDQGFAYRFVFPEEIKQITENSSILLMDDFTFWTYNGEHHNIGPEKLSTYKDEKIKNPVVFQTSAKNYFAIHEAAIFDHAPFELFKVDNGVIQLRQECIASTNVLNTSWIKAGKSMWDWRVWGYKAADGFEYGLNTVSHKRFIDFAA